MKTFNLNKKNIFILGAAFAGGVLVFAAAVLLKKVIPAADLSKLEMPLPLSLELVPRMDAALAQPYSRALDKAGDLFLLLAQLFVFIFAFAIPGVKALLNKAWSSFRTVCFNVYVYGLCILYTGGVYKALKTLGGRFRPYMYFENPDAKALLTGDFCRSWPSGHASIAFVAAGFIICWFMTQKENKACKITAAALTCFMAASTLALRILSGNHFPTDVITGAFIGSFVTLIIYFLSRLLLSNSDQ